ncbi:hypothetical protein GCM10009757_05330 [Streptomyces cheonanensis]|uniref:Uncharacterized protein n=1 Tax=Streptomyces cheonanensis TaxID=312720 RepID=A0ABN2USU7_9ACTN
MYELVLRVDAGTTVSDEQVERHVGSLYRDLRTLGLFNVRRKQTSSPAGSMASTGYEIGVLVVSGVFSAAALKAMSNVLVAYLQRSKARSVEWEFDGHKGSFQGLSGKDQGKLVDVVASRIAGGVGVDVGDGESGDNNGGTPNRAADRD